MELYKFRSLKDLRRFLDILVNRRLYMAHYNEMNDPMEGAFLANSADSALLEEIREGKRKKRICCLSEDYRNTLLWSHYADSHQGCCLEVEVLSELKPHHVIYSDIKPSATLDGAERILTYKSKLWKYEKEVRFFKDDINSEGNRTHPWLSVKIKKVYLGYRMSRSDVVFYTKLIKTIFKDKVAVSQIKRGDLDTGFRN